MNIVSKIRGLYRFDGDAEPVLVSRRSFLFMGGVVTAGAMLTWPAEESLPVYDALTGLPTGDWMTARGILLEREAAMERQLAGLWWSIPYHHSKDTGLWLNMARTER